MASSWVRRLSCIEGNGTRGFPFILSSMWFTWCHWHQEVSPHHLIGRGLRVSTAVSGRMTQPLPWNAMSIYNRAQIVDLPARLAAHPLFPELKAKVDKAYRRATQNEIFESDHTQNSNYLDAGIVERD